MTDLRRELTIEKGMANQVGKQLREAEEKVSQQSRQIQHKDGENEDLQKVVDKLTRVQKGSSTAVITLEPTVATLQAQLTKEKERHEETVKNMEADGEGYRRELEAKAHSLEQGKWEVQVQLSAEKDRVVDLQARIEQLERERATFRDEKMRARRKLDEVRSQLREQIKQGEQLQSRNEELEEQHQHDEARLGALREQSRQSFHQDETNRALENEIEELRDQVDQLKEGIATRKEQMLESSKRGLEWQATIERLEEELAHERVNLEWSRQALDEAKKRGLDMRQESRQQTYKIQGLESKVVLLEEHLVVEQNKGQESRSQIASLKGELVARDRTNQDLRDEIVRNDKEAESLRASWDREHGRVEAAKRESSELEDQVREKEVACAAMKLKFVCEERVATDKTRQLQEAKDRVRNFWTQLVPPGDDSHVLAEKVWKWASSDAVPLGPVASSSRDGQWTILDSWMDEAVGLEGPAPSLTGASLSWLLVDVYRLASMGLVEGQECQTRLRCVLEQVSSCGGTTVPVEMFVSLADVVVSAVSKRPARSFAVALAFWQVMAVVEERWPGHVLWGHTKQVLREYLEGHDYGVVFEVMMGARDLPEEGEGCHFWTDSVAVDSCEPALDAVLINAGDRTVRFFSKERCEVGLKKVLVEPQVMRPQEQVSLVIRGRPDFEWAYEYLNA